MADEGKKIIVDDDWKEQARREKEKLAEQEAATASELPAEASFADLVNVVAIQALVGLGMMAGPGGEHIPPNLGVAKHFIDLLSVLAEKTKNSLEPQEKQVLDQVLHDLRMRYVELAKAATAPPSAASPGTPPGSGIPTA